MSQREKMLAMIVGGVVAVLLNFVLIKFFIGKLDLFKKQRTLAETAIASLNSLESERTLWKERDSWLTANMTQVGDSQVSGRQISESLRDIAKEHTVTLEAPTIGVQSKQANFVSLPVRVEAKGEWKNMFEFLSDLQAPEKFLVFEQLDLKVDATDKTKLRASMALAKWFSN